MRPRVFAQAGSASRSWRCRRRLRNTPEFGDRYDEDALRLFLRDLERHIEQLAKAMETGQAHYVTSYWEWLVPVMRHRRIPAADSFALLSGLEGAVATVLSPG